MPSLSILGVSLSSRPQVYNAGTTAADSPSEQFQFQQFGEIGDVDNVGPNGHKTAMGWAIGGIAALAATITLWVRNRGKDKTSDSTNTLESKVSISGSASPNAAPQGVSGSGQTGGVDDARVKRSNNLFNDLEFEIVSTAEVPHEINTRVYEVQIFGMGDMELGQQLATLDITRYLPGSKEPEDLGREVITQVKSSFSNRAKRIAIFRILLEKFTEGYEDTLEINPSVKDLDFLSVAREEGFEWDYEKNEKFEEVIREWDRLGDEPNFNMDEFLQYHLGKEEIKRVEFLQYWSEQEVRSLYDDILRQHKEGVDEYRLGSETVVPTSQIDNHLFGDKGLFVRMQKEGKLKLHFPIRSI